MRIDAAYKFPHGAGFLVVDGVNGAGKSTFIRRLVQHLEERGVTPTVTREPGGTPLGSVLRPLLLESRGVAPLAELFMFAADRAQHVATLIRPALAAGRAVISDRYYYSTTAFQGYGRGLPLERVEAINALAIDGCLPDLLLLLDLDPAEGLRRTRSRQSNGEEDRIEHEELAFHHRLRDGFLDLARRCREPCLVIDAAVSQELMWRQAEAVVENWLAACEHGWTVHPNRAGPTERS